MTYAAGAGLHEHELALTEPGSSVESFPRRNGYEWRSRSLDETQFPRLFGQVVLIDHFEFFVRPRRRPEPAVAEIDLVSGAYPRYRRPGALDHPGPVPTQHGRQ